MKEQWKDINNYKNLYQISNIGRVKRLTKYIIRKKHHCKIPVLWKGRILKQQNMNGYRHVELCKNGIRKIFSVHRLVAIAFISNPKKLPCVNHKDLNKANNRIENLEWCSPLQNVYHAIKNGRAPRIIKGEECPWSKLTEKKVKEIRHLVKIKKCTEIAKKYNVSGGTINDIKHNRRWKWLK